VLRAQQKPFPVVVHQLNALVARNVECLFFAEKTDPESPPAVLGNWTVPAHQYPGDPVSGNLLVLPLEWEESVINAVLPDGRVEPQEREKNGDQQNKAVAKSKCPLLMGLSPKVVPKKICFTSPYIKYAFTPRSSAHNQICLNCCRSLNSFWVVIGVLFRSSPAFPNFAGLFVAAVSTYLNSLG
jgi:hypothetical protein